MVNVDMCSTSNSKGWYNLAGQSNDKEQTRGVNLEYSRYFHSLTWSLREFTMIEYQLLIYWNPIIILNMKLLILKTK